MNGQPMTEPKCPSLQASTGRCVHAGCNSPAESLPLPVRVLMVGSHFVFLCQPRWFQRSFGGVRGGCHTGSSEQSSSKNYITLEVLLGPLPCS